MRQRTDKFIGNAISTALSVKQSIDDPVQEEEFETLGEYLKDLFQNRLGKRDQPDINDFGDSDYGE